jgi:NAD(P)-dependent dehydrogenase (short-subunit alcohol dehydrogenase family)
MGCVWRRVWGWRTFVGTFTAKDILMSISGDRRPTLLLIGASRGLGLAMAAEFLKRGWNVVGTARDGGAEALRDLADQNPGRVDIEILDVTAPDQISALYERLLGRRFDILFHNAGVTDANPRQPAAEVSTEDFARVLVTNALSPMRVIEGLQDLVPAEGLIGVMSSGQGSIGNNERAAPRSTAPARPP